MNIEKIAYRGWGNCYRLSNALVDLIATTDVGPRIIRFGLIGQANEFKEYADQLGKTGGEEWRIYGGHRLWHAPEHQPRTYFPDNFLVKFEQHPDFVRLIQPLETTTGIQKEIDLTLASDQPRVQVTHRLRNLNLWTVEFAPWALTVMDPGGRAILPLPKRGSHLENLLPTSSLTLWAYTDLSDPRWTLGREFIMLQQDARRAAPQKIGALVPDGWIAYAHNRHLFVKQANFISGAVYPDMGCSIETFTNDVMLEMETLGPIVRLEPGTAVEHVEQWSLYDNVPIPQNDADVRRDVLSKIV